MHVSTSLNIIRFHQHFCLNHNPLNQDLFMPGHPCSRTVFFFPNFASPLVPCEFIPMQVVSVRERVVILQEPIQWLAFKFNENSPIVVYGMR